MESSILHILMMSMCFVQEIGVSEDVIPDLAKVLTISIILRCVEFSYRANRTNYLSFVLDS